MFYGAYADCGKGMQCVVAIFHILYGDELVEKLRQDFLDIVSFFVFRSIPDCVVISLRTVHYCSGYVSQPGNNQFQRSLGVAGQPDTGYCYCSAVIYSGIGSGDGICHQKRELPELFIHRERKRARLAMIAGVLSLGAAYLFDSRYELKSDLYPANVCYNIALAFQRTAQTQSYAKTSKDFTFQAKSVHPQKNREVYVMVIGETSRSANWSIYGYNRETNPKLSKVKGLTAFCHVLTESNTTHKSVPMLMSSVSAHDFNSIYQQKSIITAFKEAGYQTAFFSNQRYNHSFIDFFGKEADTCNFIKENVKHANYNPSDDELLELVATELAKNAPKQFIVLHTYGSHFNYRERYPSENAFFLPDFPVDAEVKYKDNLVNAYDNSIRYTDDFLARLIGMLQEQNTDAAMLYTSDHGEDIFDDSRRLFLHASPVPSYYQIHVPFLLWMSDSYRDHYPSLWENTISNKQKNISSSASFFHTMLELGGVTTPYRNDSLSVVNGLFTEKPRVYLNDHNEARSLNEIGMGEEDFEMLQQKGILYR